MAHCNERGSEVIVGDKCHIFMFEQGAAAQVAGVQLALVKNNPDGTFSLDEMELKIRKEVDIHTPFTRLICVENTHNVCGGTVLPLEWLDKVCKIAKQYQIPVHMDGARVLNAVVQSGIPARRITQDVDTVMFCLSKGLACPIGSLLCGSKEFIKRAERVRKLLGGGMRQAGIVAAAGIVALDNMVDRLFIDHDNIYAIASAVHAMDSNMFRVDLSLVHTNILVIFLDTTRVNVKQVLTRLQKVEKSDEVKVIVKASSTYPTCIRMVTYWEINDESIGLVIEKIRLVIRELEGFK